MKQIFPNCAIDSLVQPFYYIDMAMDAIKQINKEEYHMRKFLALLLVLCMTAMVLPGMADSYTAGTYEASAQGFGGKVSVSITVDAEKIVAVTATGEAESSPAIGNDLSSLADQILAAQGTEIDGVTGATVTTDAVKAAAAAALAQAAGQELAAPEAADMADGTYTASAPSFANSGIKVTTVTLTATVKDNQIIDIAIGEYGDTEAIGGMAFPMLAEQVVATQSLGIDSITGATVSSSGFKTALSDIISQAGGNPDEWKARPVEKRAAETAELTTDIVVIGAGIAGLSAAVEAVDKGANVILLEKQAVLGSSTTRSEGFVQGANTQLQKDNGVEDTVESLYNDIMEVYASEPNMDAELIKVAAYGSTDLIQFLLDNGVVFNHLEAISKNHPRNVPRNHCVEGGGGGITSALYKSFLAKGGTAMLGTPATELIMDNDAVVGVKATNTYGDDITIHASSVILCAGSYSANPVLFKTLHPDLVPESISGSGEGDSYYLSQQAGAEFVTLPFAQMMYYFYSNALTGWPSVIPGAPLTSAIVPATDLIWLNGAGERVANEDEFCFDFIEKNWEGRYTEAWALGGAQFAADHPDVIEIALTSKLTSREGDMGYKADTLEEMAALTGLDAEVLKATVDRYNALCDAGNDEDFLKPAEYMKRVDAPYYIMRMPLIVTDGYDGVKIDQNAQALRPDGTPIKGLYAAGSCAVGNMSSVRYYGCGTSLLIGGVYGRIAADQTAELIGK